MIKIEFRNDFIDKNYNLPTKKAVISLIIYFFVMFFGGFFIYLYIEDNPVFFDNYSETDTLIQVLYTKNGIGLVKKDDFHNSIYKDPSVDVYSFTTIDSATNEPIIIEPFLDEYLLVASVEAFSSSQIKIADKPFLTNIFTADEFYNDNYRVYRYLPKSLNADKEKLTELFGYFQIENPIFDAETNAKEELNGIGSSVVNYTLYSILFIGLLLVMFNIIKNDFLKITSFGKTLKASLIGLGMVYLFNILGNMVSIVISALLKEKVIETANEMVITDTLKSGGALLMVISVVILGPIVEELIFRKSIFSLFKNKIFALIISSLIFAFIHLTEETSLKGVIISLPAYLIPGLVFGYIYYKNDENILVPTLTHVFSNLISVVLLYLI